MGPYFLLDKYVNEVVDREEATALSEIENKVLTDNWEAKAKRTISKFRSLLKSCLSAISHASCYAATLSDFESLEGQFVFLLEWRLADEIRNPPSVLTASLRGSEVICWNSPSAIIKRHANMIRNSLQKVMLYEPLFVEEQSGNIRKNQNLTPVQGEVLRILRQQPKGVGISGPKIIEALSKTRHLIEESTLRKHVIPLLKEKYGVKNSRSKGGYFLP